MKEECKILLQYSKRWKTHQHMSPGGYVFLQHRLYIIFWKMCSWGSVFW